MEKMREKVRRLIKESGMGITRFCNLNCVGYKTLNTYLKGGPLGRAPADRISNGLKGKISSQDLMFPPGEE